MFALRSSVIILYLFFDKNNTLIVKEASHIDTYLLIQISYVNDSEDETVDSIMNVKEIAKNGVEMNETGSGKEKTFDDKDFKVSSWGYRHQQSLILFFVLTIAYSMRACIGVALVAMTHHELHSNGTGNGSAVDPNVIDVDEEDYKANGFFNALMLSPPYPTFKWSKKVQDTVIASFFWGYMTLQIPSGQLAHRFGARRLLCVAMLINSVVSILFPVVAYYGGWITTVIFRIMQGLSQSCIFPGMHTFFGKWAPLEERGRLTALTYGGQALGTVLGLPITGFISTTSLGWPGIFRLFGILSGIMAGVLWFFCADTPAMHPRISAAERKYIENGLGLKKGDEKRQMRVPWSQILRCKGLYAIILAHIGHTWGQLILYSEVPAYMDKVMNVNIKANGLLTALPFMVMWITNFFFSWFTDMLIVKKLLNVTNTRKLANSIGCVIPAIGLVVLAFVPKNIYVVETILIIVCGTKVSAHMGFQINHIDISPNFAGTMMSLSNFMSNLVGSLAPILAGVILTDVHDANLWRYVFFMAAGLYFFTNLMFVILGTGEKAAWDNPDFNQAQDDKKPGGEESLPMLNGETRIA